MGPVRLNRRRFLGASAAAGLAMSQGLPVEGEDGAAPIRTGLIGAGNRGTTLLRTLLELKVFDVRAICDVEPRHLQRAQGIAEKASGRRPDACDEAARLLARDDLDAVVVALPCDLHASVNLEVLRAGKHLYAEKPLGLSLAECDALIDEHKNRPDLVFHVGFQRRSNPRYREGVELIHSGAIGQPLEARLTWTSSNGPIAGHQGWLGRRDRSGDWMIEQAVHVWDLLHWITGGPPAQAFGYGHRNLFRDADPARDVTDQYSVILRWSDGFSATFVHSWMDPADEAYTGTSQLIIGSKGGVDFQAGVATFKDRSRPRSAFGPGVFPDTRLALATFAEAIRHGSESITPPLPLEAARMATLTGLLVRQAIDEARVVTLAEILSGSQPGNHGSA